LVSQCQETVVDQFRYRPIHTFFGPILLLGFVSAPSVFEDHQYVPDYIY